MTCPLKHRSQPGIPRDLKQFYMYNLWEASHVANYLKLWALFAVPYSPSERTGRSPSSVVCCFSAFYINILFNLHQTCAGPTLFEVGMLLFSAHIYPFLLQHCIFLIRSASIPLLNLWGWRRGGVSVVICSCFGLCYTGPYVMVFCGGCVITNRRCSLFHGTWSHPGHAFTHGSAHHSVSGRIHRVASCRVVTFTIFISCVFRIPSVS